MSNTSKMAQKDAAPKPKQEAQTSKPTSDADIHSKLAELQAENERLKQEHAAVQSALQSLEQGHVTHNVHQGNQVTKGKTWPFRVWAEGRRTNEEGKQIKVELPPITFHAVDSGEAIRQYTLKEMKDGQTVPREKPLNSSSYRFHCENLEKDKFAEQVTKKYHERFKEQFPIEEPKRIPHDLVPTLVS